MLILAASATTTTAQTGGGFDLSYFVIASGGGSNSTGSSGPLTYRVEGTAGQNLAGTVSTGGQFSVRGGFWAFEQPVPTAALVTVAGRVTSSRGRGITARVYLIDSSGVARMVMTNTFGFYQFQDIEVGDSYVVTVFAKGYQFVPQVITVEDAVSGLNFVGIE